MKPSRPWINFYIKSFSGNTNTVAFACGNLFNNGKMLHSFTLHTSDMKYKYMKST